MSGHDDNHDELVVELDLYVYDLDLDLYYRLYYGVDVDAHNQHYYLDDDALD